jgi:hypothetical protein
MHQALRCPARSKRSGDGGRSPAVQGYSVCRMHEPAAALLDEERNALKHGLYTAEADRGAAHDSLVAKQARIVEALWLKVPLSGAGRAGP